MKLDINILNYFPPTLDINSVFLKLKNEGNPLQNNTILLKEKQWMGLVIKPAENRNKKLYQQPIIKNHFVTINQSVFYSITLCHENEIDFIPIINPNNEYLGCVTLKILWQKLNSKINFEVAGFHLIIKYVDWFGNLNYIIEILLQMNTQIIQVINFPKQNKEFSESFAYFHLKDLSFIDLEKKLNKNNCTIELYHNVLSSVEELDYRYNNLRHFLAIDV